jgi:hypothetical protein
MGHRVDVISGEPYPELDARVGLDEAARTEHVCTGAARHGR